MAAEASAVNTGDILSQLTQLKDSSKNLITNINQNFKLKIDTSPLDKFGAALDKVKKVSETIDYTKQTLGIAKLTSETIKNALETAKDMTAHSLLEGVKNSEIVTDIKAIFENTVESAGLIKDIALKAKDVIQTGLESAAKKTATVVGAALDAVTDANPIGLVIAAITILIGVFVLLFAKCKPFHDWVMSAFNNIKASVIPIINAVKDAFSDAFNNIKSVVTSVLGTVGSFISNTISNIKEIFNGIIEFFSGVFTGNWKKAFQGLQDIVGGIFGQIVNVVKTPINVLIDVINGLIGGMNNVIKLGSKIPGVGSLLNGVQIPTIPHLASGGIIDSPTLALIGEAGTEAVVPLQSNTGWMNILAENISKKISGGSGDIQLTVPVTISGIGLVDTIVRKISRSSQSRNNPVTA